MHDKRANDGLEIPLVEWRGRCVVSCELLAASRGQSSQPEMRAAAPLERTFPGRARGRQASLDSKLPRFPRYRPSTAAAPALDTAVDVHYEIGTHRIAYYFNHNQEAALPSFGEL
jgi:hypothetical protein